MTGSSWSSWSCARELFQLLLWITMDLRFEEPVGSEIQSSRSSCSELGIFDCAVPHDGCWVWSIGRFHQSHLAGKLSSLPATASLKCSVHSLHQLKATGTSLLWRQIPLGVRRASGSLKSHCPKPGGEPASSSSAGDETKALPSPSPSASVVFRSN